MIMVAAESHLLLLAGAKGAGSDVRRRIVVVAVLLAVAVTDGSSDCVRVIAGRTLVGCAAGGYVLEAPLANRFCHVEFTPSVDEWLDGMSTGWGAPPASRAVATDEQRACVGAQFDHRLCAAQS